MPQGSAELLDNPYRQGAVEQPPQNDRGEGQREGRREGRREEAEIGSATEVYFEGFP
jgi:hypothetical protein